MVFSTGKFALNLSLAIASSSLNCHAFMPSYSSMVRIQQQEIHLTSLNLTPNQAPDLEAYLEDLTKQWDSEKEEFEEDCLLYTTNTASQDDCLNQYLANSTTSSDEQQQEGKGPVAWALEHLPVIGNSNNEDADNKDARP